MLMLTILFRASDTSSVLLYPTFLLIAVFIDVGWIVAFDLLVIASFHFIC